LELGFLDSDSGDYLDADRRRIDPADDATRAVTPLVRDGRPVAVIVHEAALLRDPGLIEEVVSAGGLAIQHERFRAEVGAQLEHLRGSRTRIVEAGDTERRKLERDLHDGAQQRLVGVSLALRLLRNASTPGAALSGRLDEAEAELRAALEELRELAHGIFPASLAEEGLAAAIETLAESSPASVRLGTLTDRRFDPAVEAAAYFVVAEVLRRSQPARASVTASHVDARLLVDLETDTDVVEPLVDLEDRVGALDGQITVSRAGHGLHVRAELPCA
jgi:signal transduction histidine kinase